MKYILGIDIGTGSVKAVALNLNYETIATCQYYYPGTSPFPGYNEQEPELIWDAFTKCMIELAVKLGKEPLAVSLSSAMHSLIVVDEEGKSLAPMMTWADARSAEIADRIKQTEEGIAIYKATGTPIHAMSPLCKLIWLREHRPLLFSQAYKFISIKEYIWYRLFKEFKVDHSIASSTGLFDILKLSWNKAALHLVHLTEEQLSLPVSTSYTHAGISDHTIPALQLFNPSIFVIGASDGCLANLGSQANTPGVAALTIGTSGAVRIASRRPILNPNAMTFSYLLDEQTYICGGPVNNGGIALQWLLKNMMGVEELSEEVYEQLFVAIDSVAAGSNGVIFLPYLNGERAPIWDSESCGTFFGLRSQHHKPHLSRAVLEGICYALYDVLLAVEQNSDEIKQLHVSGGFIHSRVWMQLLADVTGKKIVIIQKEDASAIGAAYLAAKALKLEDGYPAIKLTGDIIIPNFKNHEVYLKNFLIFKELYINLKTTMHQIYQMNN